MMLHLHDWKRANISLGVFDASAADMPFIVWKNATTLVFEIVAHPVTGK
jgi:hypothetical protein